MSCRYNRNTYTHTYTRILSVYEVRVVLVGTPMENMDTGLNK